MKISSFDQIKNHGAVKTGFKEVRDQSSTDSLHATIETRETNDETRMTGYDEPVHT